MTGADSHTLELQAGDALQIRFSPEKGSLKLTITAPDGAEVYTGNGTEAADFTVNIPESGIYTVSVEARNAAGTLRLSAVRR